MSRPQALVAVVLGIATMSTARCGPRDGSSDDGLHGMPKAVRMAVVELSDNPQPTKYSAIIAPNAQVDLAFRIPGYVVYLQQARGGDGRVRPLEPGAAVVSGMILARIRVNDYQAVANKALGARDESTAGIAAAESKLVETQADLAQAELDFGRVGALWEQESVTKPVFDASKTRLDTARAKVGAATAAVEAARQRAASASAQLQEAQIALGDTELRAPLSGTLLERRVEVGNLVTAGTPAFTVADLRFVKARFNVPDTALHSFRDGQTLVLGVDAFADERFEGRVLSVAAAADPRARSFEINVAVANPGLKLRSGMIASIQAAEDTTQVRHPRIPIDALVHDPTTDRYLAYTAEQKDGRAIAKAIPIRPGPIAGNQVLILDGLTAGQRIIVSGANLLRPGDVVKEIQ
jgi:multidrug efflux pump subunit AcrA (membrane-fusion protein)